MTFLPLPSIYGGRKGLDGQGLITLLHYVILPGTKLSKDGTTFGLFANDTSQDLPIRYIPTRSLRHDFLRAFRLLCGKLAAPCNTRLRSLIFFHSTHQQRKEGGASALYAIFRNSVLKIKILFYVFCLSERVCVWFINIRKRLTFHIRTDRLGNKSFAIFSIENVDLVRKQLTLVETEKLVDIQFNFKTS